MIIMLIFVSLLIIGVIGLIINKCIDEFSSTYAPDWLGAMSFAFIILSIMFFIIIGGVVISIQINKDVDYENMVERREALVKGVELAESGNITLTNVNIYSDVASFNAELRKTKKWANNPWVSIFHNQLIADNIDYITLPE